MTRAAKRTDRPILEDDRQAPRKQRHTAHRIWVRLRQERPEFPIGEATVRRYVRQRKQELGLRGAEVFILQSYDWGQEAQVDWFEATAKLGGEATLLQFFAMRSMASGDGFHCAFRHATQQAFLKPGALAGSLALEQCRQQGRWPESFDRFWAHLREQRGKAEPRGIVPDVSASLPRSACKRRFHVEG